MTMGISVVIPTYNSSATIETTLNSVFQQTVTPSEIIVLDDGSTDNTIRLLSNYKHRITILHQKNKGVANARNTLCQIAKGDLIAFLDHDDIWHPNYLEIQSKLYKKYSDAVGFFAGHVDFYGYKDYEWEHREFKSHIRVDVLDSLRFFNLHNKKSGLFGSASFICIPKKVLTTIGDEPFCEKVSGVDDAYLCTLLPLLGKVVFTHMPLVAYRIIKEAQSTDKLKAFELWVRIFELLDIRYKSLPDARLSQAFRLAFASKRRQYAKRLMGAHRSSEARRQIWCSLRSSKHLISIAKSLTLMSLTYVPKIVQPKWPSSNREWQEPNRTKS
jgi:glycosyltransferase involved in cell wall biosynthesis